MYFALLLLELVLVPISELVEYSTVPTQSTVSGLWGRKEKDAHDRGKAGGQEQQSQSNIRFYKQHAKQARFFSFFSFFFPLSPPAPPDVSQNQNSRISIVVDDDDDDDDDVG